MVDPNSPTDVLHYLQEQELKERKAENAKAWRKKNPEYHTNYMRQYRKL